MNILDGGGDFFGLDIGTTAIRVVQLSRGGQTRSLLRYGQAPLDGNVSMSSSEADRQKLGAAIKQLITSSQISATNVAVNLPSNRVFTAVIDFDKLSPQEMGKAISYQADSLVPTPLAKSKLDWAILGNSPVDAKKVEILISSVANDYVESRINLLENIGLNVIACEPDGVALTRSLLSADALGAQMILDIGYQATDLVIAFNGSPRMIRSVSVGTSSVIKAASQNMGVDAREASQYVFKFGLSRDKFDGKVYAAILSTVESLTSEVDKSVKFFKERYSDAKLDRIVVTGGASTIPDLPLHLANHFGINVEIGNAWRNVALPANVRDNAMSLSSYFAVATGIAQRNQ